MTPEHTEYIGGRPRHDATIQLAASDPGWPLRYDALAELVRGALDGAVLTLEHVGSTSVPGLAAKPVVDMLLVVSDPRDEAAYVPTLESCGFALRVREPGWHEHRLLRHTEPAANLHVFGPGTEEVERMLAFRDWLRTHPEDRTRYERRKHELAAREWAHVQDYADAKSGVVEEILARARAR